MTKINLIIMLLPFVFMVHDYEEIIMFRRWIDRNREELRKRFPKVESFFYSTRTFRLFHFHLCRWYCSRVHTYFCCFVLLGLDRSISMVVCCIDRIFRSLVNAYRTVDCISKVCAGYHYKPPNIALLHLFFC